jgi:hypothetical protein
MFDLDELLSATLEDGLSAVIFRLSAVYPLPRLSFETVADFLVDITFLSGAVLVFLCLETEDEAPVVSLLLLTDGDENPEGRLSDEFLPTERYREPEIPSFLPTREL